ncbi:MAG: LacI family DNA-binding transcriptional regulator [Chloroflexi bacterium]|nr:LacI family DNA-binding transcriptional regulator [Chloroflexota bacterium]
MTISIKDIAKEMNISYSTVSRALNNSPRIKSETRQQIQRKATEMGYLPSAVARSLVTRRTNTMGVIVTKITDLFFAEVIQGIEETALNYGYNVILTNSDGVPEHELAAIQNLRERRVDGIILVAACASKESKERLFSSPVVATPIVIINNVHQEHVGYSVETDNVGGGQIATQHLLDLGHRRVAYIAGPTNEWDGVERQQGYEQAHQATGLSVDPALIVRGNNRPDGGLATMQQLLALPSPPTAVFCYNDATALGAMRAAHAAGWRIPQDVSIVGFDDIALASFFEPPLTTIAQAKQEMGGKAVQMVLDLLASERVVENTVLPSQLILRESTGSPRTGL